MNCTQPSPDIRAGAHTDYGSITLLFQHRVSGLQVRRGDDWIDVPPRSGCLVINIGDALEFWSGGRFKVGEARSKATRALIPVDPAPRRHAAGAGGDIVEILYVDKRVVRLTPAIAYFVHPDTDSILDPFVDEQ